jgi:hypothetical protein
MRFKAKTPSVNVPTADWDNSIVGRGRSEVEIPPMKAQDILNRGNLGAAYNDIYADIDRMSKDFQQDEQAFQL